MIGPQPHPLRWIAADDYAAMVSRAYDTPETEGKTLFVVGPEAYNKVEALKIYCRIVQPGMKMTVLSIGLMRVIAALSFSRQLKADTRRMAFYNTIGDDFGDPAEAERLVGKATTTLEAWCRRQAQATQK
jgi:NADH dehydrogenase